MMGVCYNNDVPYGCYNNNLPYGYNISKWNITFIAHQKCLLKIGVFLGLYIWIFLMYKLGPRKIGQWNEGMTSTFQTFHEK